MLTLFLKISSVDNGLKEEVSVKYLKESSQSLNWN